MNSKQKTSTRGAQGRARETGKARETAGKARRESPAGAGSNAILCVAVIVAVLPVLGCGNHKSERPAAGSSGGSSATVERYVPAVPASTEGIQAQRQGPDSEAAPVDSLPPDVTASAADTLTFPGGTVEITARASVDVVEVVLWDGIGRRQSFAYDTTAGIWRASYRVPLGISRDRLGLSVTAKNGHDLRDRVWVFLQIQREAPAETKVAQPASQPQSGL